MTSWWNIGQKKGSCLHMGSIYGGKEKMNRVCMFMYITDDSAYLTSEEMTQELRELLLTK